MNERMEMVEDGIDVEALFDRFMSDDANLEDTTMMFAPPSPPPPSSREVGRKSKRQESLLGSPMSFSDVAEDDISTASSSPLVATTTTTATPPLCALGGDLTRLRVQTVKSEYMTIKTQPPLEVRTRTKNENRTFTCAVNVNQLPVPEMNTATVQLCYATDTSVMIDTLGGTLTRPIVSGKVCFDDLSISVASPKHAEKEFVLKISLTVDGVVSPTSSQYIFSSPFYAYSHKSVLKRRRGVNVVAASCDRISCHNTEARLHIIGTPFVRSDRLQCVFRVRRVDCDEMVLEAIQSSYPYRISLDAEWVSVKAENMEFYSESVIFFALPKSFEYLSRDIQAYVQVTNDGRNFSNPLPVMISANGGYPAPKRQAIRSRM